MTAAAKDAVGALCEAALEAYDAALGFGPTGDWENRRDAIADAMRAGVAALRGASYELSCVATYVKAERYDEAFRMVEAAQLTLSAALARLDEVSRG